MGRGDVAAAIHKRMVRDERFGYSWEERWGATPEKWTVGGVPFSINVGDYDCSSSAITAWGKALAGTKYEGCLSGATYTGNMRSVFVKSGLFEWKPASFIASPGDLYLSEANHVAVCQRQVPDELSEFSWGDNGAYGNRRGDQSGWESRVNPYYDYPWDGILHYNGKADGKEAKVLYGIDVSSNQPKRIVRDVDNDFAIVKLTGNPHGYAWDYVNGYAKQQAADAMRKHGLLGLYHFAYGIQAAAEADFFVDKAEELGYVGKALLVLDYEADAVAKGSTWVRKFCERVRERTGVTPVVYASGSVIASQSLFSLGYPIWCANYSAGYASVRGYDTSGMSIYPGCSKAKLWQFTSSGRLDGYSGNLDLNAFYGTAADWKAMAAKAERPASPEYRCFRDGKWRPWRKDGASCGVSGTAIYDLDFRNLGPKGWFRLTLEGGKVLRRNRNNTAHAKRVIGVEVVYGSDAWECVYRVQTASGAWLKWEHDARDGGAGDDVNALCRLQLRLAAK